MINYTKTVTAENLLKQKGILCGCPNCNYNQHRNNGHVEFNIGDNFKADLQMIKQFLTSHRNIKTINFTISHSFPDFDAYNYDSSSYSSSDFDSSSFDSSSYFSSSSESYSSSSDSYSHYSYYFSENASTVACTETNSESLTQYYPVMNPESLNFSKKQSYKEEFENVDNLSLNQDKSHQVETEKAPTELQSIKSSNY